MLQTKNTFPSGNWENIYTIRNQTIQSNVVSSLLALKGQCGGLNDELKKKKNLSIRTQEEDKKNVWIMM